MSLRLGVDGGASKAIAVVATAEGDIIGAARQLGTADIYAPGGETEPIDLVAGVIDEALAQAHSHRSDVAHAVLSLAGADWPEDFAYHEESWSRFGFGGPAVVINDAIGALVGAVPAGPAVVVAIGTGAATGARGSDDAQWHSSFWQLTQGAAELATRTLDATVRAELGIGPPTALRGAILEMAGAETVENALHQFKARRRQPLPAGAVVRALFAAARAADPVATRLLEDHGSGLGEVAATAARRVSIAAIPFALSFTGGLARAGAETLVRSAVAEVESSGLAPRVVPPRWEAAIGALVVGFQAEGSWSLATGERLDATRPPPKFYEILSP